MYVTEYVLVLMIVLYIESVAIVNSCQCDHTV